MYATDTSHIRRIGDFIADTIWQLGYVARAIDLRDINRGDLRGVKALVLGAATHDGRIPKNLTRFVRQRRELLRRIPNAFFSVSIQAASRDPDVKQQAIATIDQFLAEMRWRPSVRASFGGPAPSPRAYPWPTRLLKSMTAATTDSRPGTTPLRRPTNWKTVAEFARTLVHTVEELERARVTASS